MTAEPDAGAVGPRILNPDGSTYPSARAVPSLFGGAMHAVLHPFWKSNPWSVRYRNDTDAAVAVRDVGWLSGACVLVRRSAFDAIGGFDAAYFMYFEDVDLGERFGRYGWRNVYDPSAVVTHIGGESTKSESAAMKMKNATLKMKMNMRMKMEVTGNDAAPMKMKNATLNLKMKMNTKKASANIVANTTILRTTKTGTQTKMATLILNALNLR
jgi:GT2 family glycosyltransferase